MATWAWVVIAVAVVVLLVIVALAVSKRRSAALQARFGPEYERTVEASDGRRAAESDLRNRQKQREQLTITPLPEPARERHAQQWRDLQQRFVDQPSSAVIEADALVQQVMGAEGYPMDDFDAQADLVSVDHPAVVQNYRSAHRVYERTQTQEASTEDMRTALLSYRSLFDELLSPTADDAPASDQAAPTTSDVEEAAAHPNGQPYRGQHHRTGPR